MAAMAAPVKAPAGPSLDELRAEHADYTRRQQELSDQVAAVERLAARGDPAARKARRSLKAQLVEVGDEVALLETAIATRETEAAASERAARIRAAEAIVEQAAERDAAAFDRLQTAWASFETAALAKVQTARDLFAARDALNEAVQGAGAHFLIEPYRTIRARPLGRSGQADTMVQWSRRLTPGLIRTLCRVEP